MFQSFFCVLYMGFFEALFGTKRSSEKLYGEKAKAMSALQKRAAMGITIVQKKPLEYSRIDFHALSDAHKQSVFKSFEKSSKKGGIYDDKVIPKLSIVFGLPVVESTPFYITTFFKGFFGFIDVEEENVTLKPGSVLIKGPLSEVYASSEASISKNYVRRDGIYVPSIQPREALKATSSLMSHMLSTGLFSEVDEDVIEIYTSYGGTHRVSVGDYLIVDGDNFYRVKKSAFKKTYEIIGFKKDIENSRASIGGRTTYVDRRGRAYVKRAGGAWQISQDNNKCSERSKRHKKTSCDSRRSTRCS